MSKVEDLEMGIKMSEEEGLEMGIKMSKKEGLKTREKEGLFEELQRGENVSRRPVGVPWVEASKKGGRVVRKIEGSWVSWDPVNDPYERATELLYPIEMRVDPFDFGGLSSEEVKELYFARLEHRRKSSSAFPVQETTGGELEDVFLKKEGLLLIFEDFEAYEDYFSGKWHKIIMALIDSLVPIDHLYDIRVSAEDLCFFVYNFHRVPWLVDVSKGILSEEDKRKPLWVVRKNVKRAISSLMAKGVFVEEGGMLVLNIVFIPAKTLFAYRKMQDGFC